MKQGIKTLLTLNATVGGAIMSEQNDDQVEDDLVLLDEDLVDMLLNYDQFFCRNCGQGCSVPVANIPDVCRKCGGTTFQSIMDVVS